MPRVVWTEALIEPSLPRFNMPGLPQLWRVNAVCKPVHSVGNGIEIMNKTPLLALLEQGNEGRCTLQACSQSGEWKQDHGQDCPAGTAGEGQCENLQYASLFTLLGIETRSWAACLPWHGRRQAMRAHRQCWHVHLVRTKNELTQSKTPLATWLQEGIEGKQLRQACTYHWE